jgi:hypothetical protein
MKCSKHGDLLLRTCTPDINHPEKLMFQCSGGILCVELLIKTAFHVV